MPITRACGVGREANSRSSPARCVRALSIQRPNGYPMSFAPPETRFRLFPNFIYDATLVLERRSVIEHEVRRSHSFSHYGPRYSRETFPDEPWGNIFWSAWQGWNASSTKYRLLVQRFPPFDMLRWHAAMTEHMLSGRPRRPNRVCFLRR
jgi:hypothetical protein